MVFGVGSKSFVSYSLFYRKWLVTKAWYSDWFLEGTFDNSPERQRHFTESGSWYAG